MLIMQPQDPSLAYPVYAMEMLRDAPVAALKEKILSENNIQGMYIHVIASIENSRYIHILSSSVFVFMSIL